MKFIVGGLCIAWGAILTLFAVASTFEYKVHFVLPDDIVETITVEHNQNVEIISVINDSYEVIEWYTDETLTQVFNRDTKVTSELYLYAKIRYLTTFKVFFDLYDGEVVHDYQLIEINNGEVIGQIGFTPEKEGYNFTGWFTDVGLTQRFNLLIDKVTTDLTLYPKWELKVFTVRFVDEANKTLKVVQVPYLEDVSISDIPQAPSKEGHEFINWDKSLNQIKENLIIKPIYQTLKYDLFVDISGEITPYEYSYGQAISLTTPVKPGQVFMGWFYISEGVEKPAPTKMPNHDLSIYAKFQILIYKVSFQVEGVVSTQDVLHGELPVVPDYTKPGYTLSWTPEIKPITADTTFIGSYQKNIHQLTVVLNNGQPNIILNMAFEQPISLTTPTFEKHAFKGWFNSADDTAFSLSLMPDKDISVYAKWEALYYVFVDNQNILPNGVKVGVNITDNLQPYKEKRGHTFLGFFKDSSFTTELKDFTMPSEDLYIYVKFEINVYTVKLTYVDEIRETFVEFYQKVQIPLEFETRFGYTLLGWYDENNLYDLDRPVVDNLNLVSRWNLNNHTISFIHDNTVSNSNTITTFTILSTNVLLPATKVGYTFIGWYTDQSLNEAFTKFSDYDENLNLYPKFEVINYRIS